MNRPQRLVFDGDYPMAQGAVDLNRDLTIPLEALRTSKQTHDNCFRSSAVFGLGCLSKKC